MRNDDFFEKRGISPAIAAARGYIRYEPGDPGPLQQAWPNHLRFAEKITSQCGGLVIPRYAPEGLGLPPISAQCRPEGPVETDRYLHYHSDDPDGDAVYPDFYPDDGLLAGHPHPRAGGPLPPEHILTGKAKQAHINSDHSGQNVQGVHWKVETAKYLYEPPPRIAVEREYEHDHAEWRGTPEALHRHIERYGDDVGLHTHRYTEKVKDENNGAAKRIDVPPGLTLEDFESADRIFFVMEGCPKTDSIRSAGEVVCGVGSVTVWDAPELPKFVETYLKAAVRGGLPVYLVPDAEWIVNKLVFRQAMLFRSRLRSLGVTNAQIAAPPPPPGGFPEGYILAVRKGEMEKYDRNGVDDHLGNGGSLDDLLVFNREVSPGVPLWVRRASGWSGRKAKRAADALEGLALHASKDGTFQGSITTLARVMDEDPRRVQRGLHDLLALGAISSDESLDDDNIALAGIRGQRVPGRWFGRRLVHGLDWENRPTVTIRTELRATQLPPARLGDHQAEEPSVEELRRELDALLENIMRTMGELFDHRRATRRPVFHPLLKQARDHLFWIAHEGHGWGPREFERRLKGVTGMARDTVSRVLRRTKVQQQQIIEAVREIVNADGEKTRELIVGEAIARGGHPVEEAQRVLEDEAENRTK